MTTLIAEFTVVGTPVPQGSTRAFAGKGKAAGRAFLTNDPTGSISKWRGDIRAAFMEYERSEVDAAVREPLSGRDPRFERIAPHAGPVSMRLTFRLARPKSHYLPANAKRPKPELRADAPTWCAGGPDLDKLVRAVLDALTGVCYVDDALVAVIGATKEFSPAGRAGVDVRVSAL